MLALSFLTVYGRTTVRLYSEHTGCVREIGNHSHSLRSGCIRRINKRCTGWFDVEQRDISDENVTIIKLPL